MGDSNGASGFWSYATEDNRLDGGAVLALATALRQEFDLISDHPLSLFVDRESLAWGDEWRARIDSALADVTFFIPVITPRYLKRPECRREFLQFYRHAQSAGLERLVLPIMYVDVPDLHAGSDDELLAVVARTQSADWRTLRLDPPESSDYRRAVNALAVRLHQIDTEVTQARITREARTEASTEARGISETVAEINSLLPDWLNSVMGDKVNKAQVSAVHKAHHTQMEKMRKRNSPRSAIFATQLRLGPEMLPLLERFVRDAKIYVSRSAQLDPLITELGRQLHDYPEASSLVDELSEGIYEAVDNMIGSPTGHPMSDHLDPMAGLSQTLRRCSNLMREGGEIADQGNVLVTNWWNTIFGTLREGPEFQAVHQTEAGHWVREKQ